MEYLMTYGWALIILVAVISVLFSMGVFNPQNYMSEECAFQPSLQCKAVSLSSSGEFSVYLVNGMGYSPDSWEMEIEGKKSIYQMENGMIKLTISGLGSYKPYEIEKFKPVLKYKIGDEEYTITGSVTVRVSE